MSMHTETTIGYPIPLVLQQTLASWTPMDDFRCSDWPGGQGGYENPLEF